MDFDFQKYFRFTPTSITPLPNNDENKIIREITFISGNKNLVIELTKSECQKSVVTSLEEGFRSKSDDSVEKMIVNIPENILISDFQLVKSYFKNGVMGVFTQMRELYVETADVADFIGAQELLVQCILMVCTMDFTGKNLEDKFNTAIIPIRLIQKYSVTTSFMSQWVDKFYWSVIYHINGKTKWYLNSIPHLSKENQLFIEILYGLLLKEPNHEIQKIIWKVSSEYIRAIYITTQFTLLYLNGEHQERLQFFVPVTDEFIPDRTILFVINKNGYRAGKLELNETNHLYDFFSFDTSRFANASNQTQEEILNHFRANQLVIIDSERVDFSPYELKELYEAFLRDIQTKLITTVMPPFTFGQ
jgi:hypothetical protein